MLDRLERENGDRLLVATLCLLEVSRAGLLESELLEMLSDEDSLVPPSPFEEKGALFSFLCFSCSPFCAGFQEMEL